MELKTQDPLFDYVGMSFGRPEIIECMRFSKITVNFTAKKN